MEVTRHRGGSVVEVGHQLALGGRYQQAPAGIDEQRIGANQPRVLKQRGARAVGRDHFDTAAFHQAEVEVAESVDTGAVNRALVEGLDNVRFEGVVILGGLARGYRRVAVNLYGLEYVYYAYESVLMGRRSLPYSTPEGVSG